MSAILLRPCLLLMGGWGFLSEGWAMATKSGYRDRLAQMNDVELEGEWRGKLAYKLAYNACQGLCDEIWFESCDRGLGAAFMQILNELKAERRAEQAAQLAYIASLGVPK